MLASASLPHSHEMKRLKLTNIVRIKVLAEISEACPCQNKEVNFCNEFALLRASIERVPDDAPDLVP